MLSITTNVEQLDSSLADTVQSQIPYAAMVTLNDTAKQFQKAQIEHQHRIFTVRRASWLDNAVKITKFATKSDLVASIGIHPPGGDSRADVISKFEDQTEKTPRNGSSLAIPVAARTSAAQVIAAGMRPRSFDFHEIGGSALAEHTAHLSSRHLRSGVLRGGMRVFEGTKRTILIQGPNGGGVILQRVGRGKRAGLRVLYQLAPRARITPDLDFIKNAEAVIATAIYPNFEAALARALAGAR